MSITSKKSKPPKRLTYHVGDLPERLSKAVLELVAENGVEGVSISEAARRAGVSSGAPYRHFKDREDLLVSVAKDAQKRVWQQLKESMTRQTSPEKQIVAVVHGYFDFIRDEPAAAELLLNSGLTIAHRELDEVSRSAYEYMMEIATEISPRATQQQRNEFVFGVVAICYGSGRMMRDRFSPVTKQSQYREMGAKAVRLLIAGFKGTT